MSISRLNPGDKPIRANLTSSTFPQILCYCPRLHLEVLQPQWVIICCVGDMAGLQSERCMNSEAVCLNSFHAPPPAAPAAWGRLNCTSFLPAVIYGDTACASIPPMFLNLTTDMHVNELCIIQLNVAINYYFLI